MAKGADVMSLKTVGTIEIPNSTGSSFDHGAFDRKSRRIFVAHTGRDSVEVIDHDTQRHVATLPGFPEAAGVVADHGIVLVTTAERQVWLGSMQSASKRRPSSRPDPNRMVWRLRRRKASR
jgi:DNA-binding beta-propeller fold protein YncE